VCVCVRYVGQEPVLFSGTVSDNIARGRSGKSQSLYVLTSTYQYVSAFERKEGRKIERNT
jgi:ABC-type multidrug transport system fused ATPase/permease subunit